MSPRRGPGLGLEHLADTSATPPGGGPSEGAPHAHLVSLSLVRRQCRGGGQLLHDAAAGQPRRQGLALPRRDARRPRGHGADGRLHRRRPAGSRASTGVRTSRSTRRSRSSSAATTRPRSIGCGTRSRRTAASPVRAAGSRTASGCRGRSFRAGSMSCSTIPTPGVPAGPWRRCSRWARSRSPRWSTPPTGPDRVVRHPADLR